MAKRSIRRKQQLAYGLVIGLVALTFALVLAHGGSILNYAFPLLATVVAAVLVILRPSVYCAFVLWIWLFSPLVRRLVDYQTGYHNISPVMLTPLLVTSFTTISLLRHPRFILRREMLPILSVLCIVNYAFVVGVFTNGPLPAAFEYANWLLPLTFGVYLLMQYRNFDEIKTSLVFAHLLGLILIAGYGLYQFYQMPPWDAYWINASHFTTAGLAVAGQVRVFSTLNSPGPYAVALMSALVYVFVAKGPLRLIAGGLGLPAFGLTLVRSAWGGWLIAIMYIFLRAKSKARLRVLLAGMFVVAVGIPALTAGPIADQLSKRFASIENIQQDTSYKARQATYEQSVVMAISQPIGIGFGQIGLASKLSTGQAVVFDAGILQVPLEFGWPGTAIFVWAIVAMLLEAIKAGASRRDQLAIAGAGIFMALLAQNIFASTFSGVLGLELWIGLAIAVGPALVGRIAVSRTISIQPARRLA